MATRAAFIFAGAALLAAGVGMLLLGNAEPSYGGRTLLQWITTSSQWQEARAAREVIGIITTNSAPTLIRWVSLDTTPRLGLAKKLPNFIRQTRLMEDYIYRKRNYVRVSQALFAFQLAGTNAAFAVPALAKLATAPNPTPTAVPALETLSRIGPPALPSISQAMTNRNRSILFSAVSSLSRLGTNAAPAIPGLITALSDPVDVVPDNAITLLLKLSPEALTNLPSQ